MTDSTMESGGYQYTVEDCACEYCLYYRPHRACTQKVCCCAEERRLALEREAKKITRKRASPCHG